MGDFKLFVKRDVSKIGAKAESCADDSTSAASDAPAAPAAASAPAPQPTPAPQPAPQPVYETESDIEYIESDTETDSIVPVTSLKVGIFRRHKYVKGKRMGKAFCVEASGGAET